MRRACRDIVSTATTLRHIAYMPYRVGVYGAQSCIRPLAARSRRSVRALINATQTWHKLATHARKWLGRASPERPLHATRRRPLSSRSKLDRSTDLRASVVISIPAPIRPCNDRTAAPHRQRAQIQVALRAGFMRQLYNLDVHASRLTHFFCCLRMLRRVRYRRRCVMKFFGVMYDSWLCRRCRSALYCSFAWLLMWS